MPTPTRIHVLRVALAFGVGAVITALAWPQMHFLWSSFLHAGF
jgi:hypothetical protein